MSGVFYQLENISYSIAFIIGTLIGIIIRLLLYSFIIAILLRISTRIVAKYTPTFGKSLRVSFSGLFLSFLAMVAIRILLMLGVLNLQLLSGYLRYPFDRRMLYLVVVVLINSCIYGMSISKGGKRLGFVKGMLVCLMNATMVAVIITCVSWLAAFSLDNLISILFLMR